MRISHNSSLIDYLFLAQLTLIILLKLIGEENVRLTRHL